MTSSCIFVSDESSDMLTQHCVFYVYLANVSSVDYGPRSTESVTNSLADIVPDVMYVVSLSCLN